MKPSVCAQESAIRACQQLEAAHYGSASRRLRPTVTDGAIPLQCQPAAHVQAQPAVPAQRRAPRDTSTVTSRAARSLSCPASPEGSVRKSPHRHQLLRPPCPSEARLIPLPDDVEAGDVLPPATYLHYRNRLYRPIPPPVTHEHSTALRQAARAAYANVNERHPSAYLSSLEASAFKMPPAAAPLAAVPAATGGNVATEAGQGKYRRNSRSDSSGEVDFVSPVRKGFQNNTAEYVAMLLRYAKVQEARSPSFRKKSPPPICIPAKAA